MEKNTPSPMPLAIVISAILISASIFYLGYSINGGKISLSTNSQNTNVVASPSAVKPNTDTPSEPVAPSIQKVKVDDDPVLGSKDAPVTLIEFSDYECPFCKRHYTNTHTQIVKNYVDSGKVKVVFRDLPLTFHDPAATKDAIAANCVREQGGDTAYFKMHSKIFTQTAGNGTGITDENWLKMAEEVGVNKDTFKTCLEDKDGKQKAEVQADLAYANSLGANGTPSFFIGKSTQNGEIEGELIVGAQPYSTFVTAFDKYLK